MNFWQSCLVLTIFLLNFIFVQPSLADRPKFTKNLDYIEITKTLKELSTTTETSPEVAQKIAELEFLKHT
jgi:hypothetical protein